MEDKAIIFIAKSEKEIRELPNEVLVLGDRLLKAITTYSLLIYEIMFENVRVI